MSPASAPKPGRAGNGKPTGRALAAELQRKQQKAERRRTIFIIGGGAVGALAILALAIVPVSMQNAEDADLEAAAQAPIEGVQSFDGLSQNHVTQKVTYPQAPPVGGDHAPRWANCKAYPEPIDPMLGTHSLEHGAVWIAYRPDLPADQIQELTKLTAASQNRYLLVSPVPDAQSPVTVSAWGKQLALPDARDSRLPVFLKAYQQGPQTPEPGAPCTGGLG